MMNYDDVANLKHKCLLIFFKRQRAITNHDLLSFAQVRYSTQAPLAHYSLGGGIGVGVLSN